MWRSTFSTALLLSSLLVFAQETETEGKVPGPGEKKDFRPSVIRLGYNMVPLLSTVFTSRDWQEGQVGIDFANYTLLAEYGWQHIRRTNGYRYENTGSYFRVGAEVNMLKEASDEYGLTFGMRYARSSFSDALRFSTSDSAAFGPQQLFYENEKVTARWWELTLGLNVKIWKQLTFGYVLRYKLFNKKEGEGSLAPYDLPGYGKYRIVNAVGMDYYVSWLIPLRRQEAVRQENE